LERESDRNIGETDTDKQSTQYREDGECGNVLLTVQTRYVENRANQREQEQGDGNGKDEGKSGFCGFSEIFECFFGNVDMDRVNIAETKFFIFMIKCFYFLGKGTEGSFFQCDLGHIMDQVGKIVNFLTVAFFDDLEKGIYAIGKYFPRSSLRVLLELFSHEPQISEDGVEFVGIYDFGREESAELYKRLLEVNVERIV
jgi:hypothetical protein